MEPIIITLLAAGLFSVLVLALIRWRASRILIARSMRACIPNATRRNPEDKLYPESRFIVRLTEEAVLCERPDGRIERVAWDDLQRVEILITPDGPFSPDSFWVLHGSDCGCVIPWGAIGNQELLERLQQLPHFDNMAILNAAPKTEEFRTLCWQKIS